MLLKYIYISLKNKILFHLKLFKGLLPLSLEFPSNILRIIFLNFEYRIFDVSKQV